MYLIVSLLLITLEGVYEGLADNAKMMPSYLTKKRNWLFAISDTLETLLRTGLILSLILLMHGNVIFHLEYIPLWMVILGFLFTRMAFFNVVYNLTRKLPLFYIGTTKLLDRLFGWFFRWSKIPRDQFCAMYQFIFGIIGVTFLIGVKFLFVVKLVILGIFLIVIGLIITNVVLAIIRKKKTH